jgi:hypothetical protein
MKKQLKANEKEILVSFLKSQKSDLDTMIEKVETEDNLEEVDFKKFFGKKQKKEKQVFDLFSALTGR